MMLTQFHALPPLLPAALGLSGVALTLALSDHRAGALGGIMRARLFWPIVVCFALTACAIQRSQIANDARSNMIGLSEEQVLACMGPPLNQDAKGTTEVMWNGRVGTVDYLGPAGGLITFNEACAFAIEKCAKP
jgi:hypothetical protein